MSPKLKLHQNPQWLKEQAEKGLWYGAIAELAGVKPPTVVKYMVQYGIYTEVLPMHFTPMANHASDTDAICAFIIPGNPTVKKNSNPNKNGMRLPNKNYAPYQDLNVPYIEKIKRQLNIFIDYPVTPKFYFYRKNHIRVDISNLYEAPQDIMVRAGMLSDDNCDIVVSHHSDSRVRYDKEFPRTEVYFYKAER